MDLSDAKAIVTDIFEATGRKVDLDDPVVDAALVNSRVQTLAASRAAVAFGEAAEAAAQKLAVAAAAEREAAVAASMSLAEAVREVRAAVELGSERELARVRADFAETAQAVLRDVAGSARNDAPMQLKYRLVASLCVGGLLFAIAGGVVGAAFFGRHVERTPDEMREIAAGRDFLSILPKLDAETRSKVVKLVESTHRD